MSFLRIRRFFTLENLVNPSKKRINRQKNRRRPEALGINIIPQIHSNKSSIKKRELFSKIG